MNAPAKALHGWPQQMLPQEAFTFLHAEMGTNGPVYGDQQKHKWEAGDIRTQPLVDVGAAASLWRLSVQGGLLVDITWGTSRQFKLQDLESPLVGYFPGNLFVEARPRDPEHEGLISTVTLTPTTAPGRSNLRRVISDGVGVNAVPLEALYMQTIGATATVTQNGVAQVVGSAAGMVTIEHPAEVTTGRIHVFFEPQPGSQHALTISTATQRSGAAIEATQG
jgi:hypothetical protein